MNKPDLAACPFCGTAADFCEDHDGYLSVECGACPALMVSGVFVGNRGRLGRAHFSDQAEIAAKWNTRVTHGE